ncbi:MAG: DUF4249 family protein [Bacteroidetes bacterium]|nr:DUF4249 family protein [Bacteroidota bacterium]MDA1118991.1 DUF4249 family protein [Bacteroidota bacterium]
MKLSNISKTFVVVALLSACEKDVTVKPIKNFSGQLVIEGILFPGETPRIFINITQPFFNSNVRPNEIFVPDAQVTIAGPSGIDVLSPDSTFDKFRCRWTPYYQGNILVESGEPYDLTVTQNGNTFTASTTINQPKVAIEYVEYVAAFNDIYGGHDGVEIIFKDASGPGNFYRFQMNRMINNEVLHVDVLDVLVNSCTDGEDFLVTDLGRNIFKDENVDGSQMKILAEVAYEYLENDSTWIFIQSLDRNSAEFYEQLDLQLQARINPFVEPVLLETKIEGAIGVFGSAVRSDSVLFVFPVDG